MKQVRRRGETIMALFALMSMAVAGPVSAGFSIARPSGSVAKPPPEPANVEFETHMRSLTAVGNSGDAAGFAREVEATLKTVKKGKEQDRLGMAILDFAQDDRLALKGYELVARSGERSGKQLEPLLREQAQLAVKLGDNAKAVEAAELLLASNRLELTALEILAKDRERNNRREEAYALINRAVVVRDALSGDVPENWRAMQDRLRPSRPAEPQAAAPAKADAQLAVIPIKPDRPRLALVIGNGNYGPTGSLANPPNDARKMAESLRIAGFEVDLLIDADQVTMKKAISKLGQRLRSAGNGQTGLFFYAGHGLQWRGENYLIPVNTEIESEADVDLYAVSANTVLSQMESSGSATNIVILDACRNAPVMRSSRSGGTGLAKMDAPNGSFIAYSTAPGQVAADGAGSNSPFVTALADAVRRPGIPIEVLFRSVRKSVLQATDGLQVPWEATSLLESFEFVPG